MGHVVRDPIVTEVLTHRLIAIADEMSVTLIRSAYSTMVKESADASTAIFDRRARVLAQSTRTTLLHASSLRSCLETVLTDKDIDSMRAGDVYVMSDPYRGGIHSNDLAVFSPLLVDNRVEYFAAAVVHVADLGGVSAGGLPSQARDVFSEGILLPPVLLATEGQINTDIHGILGLNTRARHKLFGDVGALIAAVNVGVARLAELRQTHGGALAGIVDQVISYAEARVRAELASLPLGEWTSTFTVDGDGVSDRDYSVRVTLRHVVPEELQVDLGGTSPQADGPINSAYSQSISAVIASVRCFIAHDIPLNEGMFIPIKIRLPYGTLVNPAPPAAVNARIVTVTAIAEALIEILGELIPTKAIAGSAMIHVYTITGLLDGERWLYQDMDYGGIGASSDADGANASGPYFFGGRGIVTQLEAIEAEYPVLFRTHRFVADSAGPGRHRGGAGVRREFEALVPCEVTVRADRIERPPVGREGGGPGRPGGWYLTSRSGAVRRLAGKQMNVQLDAGDALAMVTTGGGGVGDPHNRDPAAVALDVRSRIVSADGAARDYGFDPSASDGDGRGTSA